MTVLEYNTFESIIINIIMDAVDKLKADSVRKVLDPSIDLRVNFEKSLEKLDINQFYDKSGNKICFHGFKDDEEFSLWISSIAERLYTTYPALDIPFNETNKALRAVHGYKAAEIVDVLLLMNTEHNFAGINFIGDVVTEAVETVIGNLLHDQTFTISDDIVNKSTHSGNVLYPSVLMATKHRISSNIDEMYEAWTYDRNLNEGQAVKFLIRTAMAFHDVFKYVEDKCDISHGEMAAIVFKKLINVGCSMADDGCYIPKLKYRDVIFPVLVALKFHERKKLSDEDLKKLIILNYDGDDLNNLNKADKSEMDYFVNKSLYLIKVFQDADVISKATPWWVNACHELFYSDKPLLFAGYHELGKLFKHEFTYIGKIIADIYGRYLLMYLASYSVVVNKTNGMPCATDMMSIDVSWNHRSAGYVENISFPIDPFDFTV